MRELENSHREVQRQLLEGMHARSDHYRMGLSSDVIIEQVLMRGIKTTGGLTEGRGMMETQRLVWILSTLTCTGLNNAIQELTSVYCT